MNDVKFETPPIRRKGLVLAGGHGTRLYPATRWLNKHLLPIYDKPMIYYPLSTLMLAGIRDIMIITTPEAVALFERVLGDGSDWGIQVCYGVQQRPEGLANALLVGEGFVGDNLSTVVLGDNLFYGRGFTSILRQAATRSQGATVFAYQVGDASRFGVVELDASGRALSIEEKPATPRSPLAVTGLYFYDQKVFDYAKRVGQAERGEAEITDLNRQYLDEANLHVEVLGRGFTWLDAGTHQSHLEASNYVASIENRQGLKIACLEEVAWRLGFISDAMLSERILRMPREYGDYLRAVIGDSDREIVN
jgi:glucose-1-phosphate thymidylyltransferase